MPQEVKSLASLSRSGQKLKVKSSEKGQVFLIIILVIIVSLTIGLSLASRGVTNLRTSTEETDSQKALSAAEAEIEKRLQNTTPGTFTGAFGTSATFVTTVDPQGGDEFLLNGGSSIIQGEGADVWIAEHLANGSIDYGTVKNLTNFHLYWGTTDETSCDSSDVSKWPAAIEVIVVSGTNATNVKTTRYAYDHCSARGNNFGSTQPAVHPTILANFKIRTPTGAGSINITDGIYVRVVPVYKSTIIGVSACDTLVVICTDLPSQGFQISSTGTTGTASRKLNVFKGHQQIFLPYISYGLFEPKKF